MMQIVASERRYRSILSPDELLIYAGVRSTEPLRLPPLQVMKLARMIEDLRGEETGNGAAWRVSRAAYRETERRLTA